MRNLSAAIVLISMLTSCTILNVYYQKKQFYPTVVSFTKHKPFFALIILQCFVLLLVIAKLISWIFFGNIRRTELDNVFSRIMYTSFDMCLLFTFFQEDISAKFLFLFSMIIFMKGFHWLLEGRVDLMERTPLIRASFHVRTISFIILLIVVDVSQIAHFYWGADSQNVASLAVGAEYYILFFELISIMMRYGLQVYDSMHDTPWDRKSLYLLYVDIVVGMLRVFFYMEFAPILWKHHPFPLFIIRPIYLNLRFLKKTIRNLIMSRRAIQLMNNVFQDVTAADMTASNDAVCIICREEMIPQPGAQATIVPGSIKRLPCGHIFHVTCLRNWFQRQQTCPTCRLNILRRPANNGQANHPQRRGARSGQVRQQSGQEQQQQEQSQSRRNEGTAQIRIEFQHTSEKKATETNVQVISPSSANPFAFLSSDARPNQATGAVPSMFSTSPIIIPGDLFFPGVTIPTPGTPADLAQLTSTEAELRVNVEARIAMLQRIQLLLDASVTQMNAYLAATTPALPTASLAANGVQPIGDDQSAGSNSLGSHEKLPTLLEDRTEPSVPKTSDELTVLRQRRLEKLSHINKEKSDS